MSVSLRLQRLIDQMDYGPAWVFGERWDIVAWNRAASVIHGDLATLQGIERNALYQLFLGDRMRSILVDWDVHGRQCVAKLRATVRQPGGRPLVQRAGDRAAHPERAVRALVERERHRDLAGGCQAATSIPEAGRLVFDYSVLEVLDERMSSLRLIAYVPAPGTGTREKMETLLAQAEPLSPELEPA